MGIKLLQSQEGTQYSPVKGGQELRNENKLVRIEHRSSQLNPALVRCKIAGQLPFLIVWSTTEAKFKRSTNLVFGRIAFASQSFVQKFRLLHYESAV